MKPKAVRVIYKSYDTRITLEEDDGWMDGQFVHFQLGTLNCETDKVEWHDGFWDRISISTMKQIAQAILDSEGKA